MQPLPLISRSWVTRFWRADEDGRSSRLFRLLEKARTTSWYQRNGPRNWPEATPEREAPLGQFRPVPLQMVIGLPHEFVPKHRRTPAKRQLHFPFPPAPRIAVLHPAFAPTGQQKVIPSLRIHQLAQSRCEVLAAPVPVLRSIAAEMLDGRLSLPFLDRAVVALQSFEQGLLLEEDRELFWHVFGVPLYEQLLGLDGELLATECEAHSGLHLKMDNAIFESLPGTDGPELLVTSLQQERRVVLRMNTGLLADMDSTTCACGLSTPRLLQLRNNVQKTLPVRIQSIRQNYRVAAAAASQ
jgi:hypothetical protein